MNDLDLMRLWLTYAPSIYACLVCHDETPTRNTDEGVYCFKHWSKLHPCDECGRPSISWMKIDGEKKKLCRRCIIGDEIPPQVSCRTESPLAAAREKAIGNFSPITGRPRKEKACQNPDNVIPSSGKQRNRLRAQNKETGK